jgi:hypothetical protein
VNPTHGPQPVHHRIKEGTENAGPRDLELTPELGLRPPSLAYHLPRCASLGRRTMRWRGRCSGKLRGVALRRVKRSTLCNFAASIPGAIRTVAAPITISIDGCVGVIGTASHGRAASTRCRRKCRADLTNPVFRLKLNGTQ